MFWWGTKWPRDVSVVTSSEQFWCFAWQLKHLTVRLLLDNIFVDERLHVLGILELNNHLSTITVGVFKSTFELNTAKVNTRAPGDATELVFFLTNQTERLRYFNYPTIRCRLLKFIGSKNAASRLFINTSKFRRRAGSRICAHNAYSIGSDFRIKHLQCDIKGVSIRAPYLNNCAPVWQSFEILRSYGILSDFRRSMQTFFYIRTVLKISV